MKQTDFTTGNVLRQMITFSLPIMLTNLLQTSYQFIDTLWVGNLIGANALGAVAISSTVLFSVLALILGVNSATLTILSQQKGMGNEEGLQKYLNAFVVILFLMSLVIGVAGYFLAEPLLRLLSTPDVMLQPAKTYLQINFIGIFFLIGYNFIGTVLRAVGDSKTPLQFVLAAVMLNALLDPLFIAGFGWGIEGAAYATVLSQGLALSFGLFIIFRNRAVPFKRPTLPGREESFLILKLGIPSALQMLVISAGMMAIMSVVNSMGEHVVAGFGAAQRLESILLIPSLALGSAVNSMSGQNIGIHKWDRVTLITRYAMIINTVVMLVIAFLLVLSADFGVGLFLDHEASRSFGAQYLRTIAFFFPFLGVNFVLNGIVRASGAMVQVLVLNLISFWILRYPLTYLFSYWWGEAGIGLGMAASFVLSSVVAALYYRYGKWKELVLFEKIKEEIQA
ncbi:MAG TPA: MATE family efflux transporter [Balneolaceae bacterium]|nr:MATE family efflux transporter [Balneolaceae bacterium]